MGISIGSPIGLYLLKFLSPSITHLSICGIIIFFVILQLQGYSNKKINNFTHQDFSRDNIWNNKWTWYFGWYANLSFLLITRVKPIVIRGSLAAIFFIADTYVFNLSFFYVGIVDSTVFFRVLPLIIVLPIGVFIGNKLFVKSKEETYRKTVFYFLIIISIIGIIKVINNF